MNKTRFRIFHYLVATLTFSLPFVVTTLLLLRVGASGQKEIPPLEGVEFGRAGFDAEAFAILALIGLIGLKNSHAGLMGHLPSW